jgi:hypothetical protein
MKTYTQYLEESKKQLDENEILQESSLSRVSAMMSAHDAAIMSAWRVATDCGKGEKISRSANESRNRELLAILKSRGYGMTTVRGTWAPKSGIVSKEDSYIIIDIKDSGKLPTDAFNMGIKYDQDSVIIKPKGEQAYLKTTNSCDGTIGSTFNIGEPMYGFNGEFRTGVNGKNFVFSTINWKISPQGATHAVLDGANPNNAHDYRWYKKNGSSMSLYVGSSWKTLSGKEKNIAETDIDDNGAERPTARA